MSQKQEHTTDDILDRAAAALRSESILPNMPADIISATITKLEIDFTNSPELVQKDLESHYRHNLERKNRIMKIFRYSSLAAAVMAISSAIIFFGNSQQNSAVAFENVLEKFKAAKSAKYIQKVNFKNLETVSY